MSEWTFERLDGHEIVVRRRRPDYNDFGDTLDKGLRAFATEEEAILAAIAMCEEECALLQRTLTKLRRRLAPKPAKHARKRSGTTSPELTKALDFLLKQP